MKTITITCLIALAVLLTACDAGLPTGFIINEQTLGDITPDTEQLIKLIPMEDNSTELPPVEIEEGSGEQDAPQVMAGMVNFESFSLTTYGISATLNGEVEDSDTEDAISGAVIVLKCEGTEIADSTTSEKGAFEFKIKSDCGFGDTVWVEVEYEGKKYKSEPKVIPYFTLLSSGGSPSKPVPTTDDGSLGTKNVPEFTPVTMILAGLGAMLGVGLLRRGL